jgi:hypothetical protein
MALQLAQMKMKLEYAENQIMNYEYEHMRSSLINIDLKSLIEEKDKIIQKQQCEMVCLAINLTKKENELNKVNDTLYEQQCIMRYVEDQANEMRDMLGIRDVDYSPRMNKMTVEELID